MAGLGHKDCEGVLALTGDDDTNLAVVMATSLLRPDLPALGRCTHKHTRARMEHFAPASAISSDDRFGEYLGLSIHRPVTYQLLLWLMENDEEKLLPVRTDLAARRWLVCVDGEFGEEVVSDLAAAGVSVELIAPSVSEPDVSGSVGFVAGTGNDTVNIALAEHTRHANPDAYIVLRQQNNAKKPLIDALQIDSVYIATELVAREVLARILTPEFWSFVEHALTQDDQWATRVRDHLVDRCDERTPQRHVLTLSAQQAPAIAEWLRRGQSLTLGDLMRRPDDREATLPLAALVVVRDGEPMFVPSEDTPLALDDKVLLVGKTAGLDQVSEICHYSATIEYLATGQEVPQSWVWAKLTARRRAGRT